MNKNNYKLVVYFIGLTIVLTIAVQVYWNIREYDINKKNLISQVQLSLDNAVEDYYANLTRTGIIKFGPIDTLNTVEKVDSVFFETKSRKGLRIKIDSTLQNITLKDSGKLVVLDGWRTRNPKFINHRFIRENIDSIFSKVIVSMSRDSLNLKNLDLYLEDEFKRNNIEVIHGLQFEHPHWVQRDSMEIQRVSYNLQNVDDGYLTAKATSHFLPYRSTLTLYFSNVTTMVLRESLISILLSLLLSGSIIFSLVYLLKTIYKQKQLAEVKNDLISNITHEFKTPIATISTALEAMKSFNAMDDKEKSEKYIGIANNQVHRLSEMVEKILETATLNHEELELKKESIAVEELIERVLDKFSLLHSDKNMTYDFGSKQTILELDIFHFTNAISNIIDNAVKYGGDIITVDIMDKGESCCIEISDNGNGIPKAQKDKIFEQFYRISTGNTHDVKGFGIGLYYTKKIIEKHGGSIAINYNNSNKTIFKITMPHV